MPRILRRRSFGSKLGNYPELGKAAAKAIPGATLVEFPEFGHAPQMTDPEGFDKALIAGISNPEPDVPGSDGVDMGRTCFVI